MHSAVPFSSSLNPIASNLLLFLTRIADPDQQHWYFYIIL
jgi:hypothetical protein